MIHHLFIFNKYSMKTKFLLLILFFCKSLMASDCLDIPAEITSPNATIVNGVYQVTAYSYQKDIVLKFSLKPYVSWTLPPNCVITSSMESGSKITISFIGTVPGAYTASVCGNICRQTIPVDNIPGPCRSASIQINVIAGEPAPLAKALNFDGNEDYLEVPGYNAVNNIGEGDFTIEARIKAIGNGRRYPAIVSNRANGTGFLMFLGDDRPNSTGQLWFNIAGINYVCSGCVSLLDNTPHMVSVSRTGGTLYMYIDGVLKYSRASYLGGTNISSTGNIRIGNDAANMPNTYFRGDISEVRIWNYARSASDIAANINKSVSGSSTGLQGYWRLNEGAGQIVYNNAFGNNIHGVLGASTTAQAIDPVWVNSTVAIPKALGSSFENSYHLGTVSSGFNFEHSRNNTDNNLDDDTRRATNDIVYSFTLAQPSLVTVFHCHSDVWDSYLSIFNANRKLVKENDDNGYQFSCANIAQAAIKMNLIAGTYYIVSEAYSSTYTGELDTKIMVAAYDAAFGTAEGAREDRSESTVKDQDGSTKEIHAYPNPVEDGTLFFGRRTAEYALLNASGEVMLKGSNVENISVENLPTGLYFLKTDGKIEKIVIE